MNASDPTSAILLGMFTNTVKFHGSNFFLLDKNHCKQMIKFLCISATHILGGCQHIVPKYKDSSPTKRPESSVDIVYQQSKLNKDLVLANHICCCILLKLFQRRISQPRLCPKSKTKRRQSAKI